jgi:hypothetical protein
MRFEFLTAMNIKVTVFWDLTPYTFVGRYQYFERVCYYHLQGSRSLCHKDRFCPEAGSSETSIMIA